VESGLPDFRLPPFESRVGNETYGLVGMASKLGSGILVVPLLSILENVSLAKFFGKSVSVSFCFCLPLAIVVVDQLSRLAVR